MIKLSKKDLSDQLNAHNRIYSNIVDNAMTEDAKNWYVSTYNEEYKDNGEVIKKGKSNPHPEDYWNKLKEDYKDEKIEDIDLQILVEKFKAVYGFDPTTTYGF